jgi:hypothetical protein
MQYPVHILPQPNFRKITNIQLLHNYHLIHFTESKDNRDVANKVREDSIVRQTDHLRDFSNSLLGTFEIDDIYLELTKGEFKNYFNADWDQGANLERTPQINRDFVINKERGFFFLSVSECNDYEVNYSDGSNVNPTCKVLHTPTNSNFWHVSLRWFHKGQDISELEERQRRKPEIKRILTAAKAFIQEKGKFDTPAYQSVDISIYT